MLITPVVGGLADQPMIPLYVAHTTANNNDDSITLPTGIQEGDLIVIVDVGFSLGSVSAGGFIGYSFAKLISDSNTSGNDTRVEVYLKVAEGYESGITLTEGMDPGDDALKVAIVYRFPKPLAGNPLGGFRLDGFVSNHTTGNPAQQTIENSASNAPSLSIAIFSSYNDHSAGYSNSVTPDHTIEVDNADIYLTVEDYVQVDTNVDVDIDINDLGAKNLVAGFFLNSFMPQEALSQSLTKTDEDSNFDDASNNDSYASMDFGAAADDRWIVVAVGCFWNTNADITSVTIDGIEAYEYEYTKDNAGGGAAAAGIYGARIPEGTSGNITINTDELLRTSAITVYRMVGYFPYTWDTSSNTNVGDSNETMFWKGDFDVPAGGIAIGVEAVDGSSSVPSMSWDERWVEQNDVNPEGNRVVTSAIIPFSEAGWYPISSRHNVVASVAIDESEGTSGVIVSFQASKKWPDYPELIWANTSSGFITNHDNFYATYPNGVQAGDLFILMSSTSYPSFFIIEYKPCLASGFKPAGGYNGSATVGIAGANRMQYRIADGTEDGKRIYLADGPLISSDTYELYQFRADGGVGFCGYQNYQGSSTSGTPARRINSGGTVSAQQFFSSGAISPRSSSISPLLEANGSTSTYSHVRVNKFFPHEIWYEMDDEGAFNTLTGFDLDHFSSTAPTANTCNVAFTDSQTDATTSNTYTFTNVDIGEEDDSRMLLFFIHNKEGTGASIPNAVYVDNVLVERITQVEANSVSVSSFYYHMPTGDTVDEIVVVLDNEHDTCGLSMFRVIGGEIAWAPNAADLLFSDVTNAQGVTSALGYNLGDLNVDDFQIEYGGTAVLGTVVHGDDGGGVPTLSYNSTWTESAEDVLEGNVVQGAAVLTTDGQQSVNTDITISDSTGIISGATLGIAIRPFNVDDISTVEFQANSYSTSSSITIPSDTQYGDIAIWVATCVNTGGTAPPTGVDNDGWRRIVSWIDTDNGDSDGYRVELKIKILQDSEAGTSVTGMNDNIERQGMVVFRPNRPARNYNIAQTFIDTTEGNPDGDTLYCANTTNPCIAFAVASCVQDSGVDFSVNATLTEIDLGDIMFGYATHTVANAHQHTWDMADQGETRGNVSLGGWIQIW